MFYCERFWYSLPFLVNIYVFAWIPICIRHGSSCLKLVVYSFIGFIYIYVYIYIHDILPYISHFSHVTKSKLTHICGRFCRDIDINFAFSVFSVISSPPPKSHQSYIVCNFTCAECKAWYIGDKIKRTKNL